MRITKPLYCVILLFCFSSYGQNLELGFRTGLNLSTLRTGDNTGSIITGSTRPLLGLNLSVNSEYEFSSHFGLEASFGYQEKGGKDFDEESVLRIGTEDFNRKLKYLNLSFLLRYYPLNSSRIRPFLTLGPGFSYLISAQESGNDIDEERIKNKFDISSIAGIGTKLYIDKDLSIELLGGIERGWNKTLRQRNPTTRNEVFESLFNEFFWFSIGLKKVI